MRMVAPVAKPECSFGQARKAPRHVQQNPGENWGSLLVINIEPCEPPDDWDKEELAGLRCLRSCYSACFLYDLCLRLKVERFRFSGFKPRPAIEVSLCVSALPFVKWLD